MAKKTYPARKPKPGQSTTNNSQNNSQNNNQNNSQNSQNSVSNPTNQQPNNGVSGMPQSNMSGWDQAEIDLQRSRDEKLFTNLVYIRHNLIKECFESYCLDLEVTQNKIEFHNYYIENPIGGLGGGSGIPSGNNADWISCVERMGTWFAQNIRTYQGAPPGVKSGRVSSAHIPCPLLNGTKIRDDCSGFVNACLNLHGVNVPFTTPTASMQPGGSWANTIEAAGFKYFSFTQGPDMWNVVQKGDIYVTDGSGHVEICWGPKMQMGWGSVHPNMPCGTTWKSSHGPSHPYKHAWRKC